MVPWTRIRYSAHTCAEPLKEFYTFITDNINAVFAGKEIAADIEPAILNMIDDRMNGRKIGIRTGDYISLQKHFQSTQLK